MSEALLSNLVQPEDIAVIAQKKGMQACLLGMADYIFEDYLRWDEYDKSRRIAKYTQDGVCELMPIADQKEYAFKYVNCHPHNPESGLSTVLAFGAICEMTTGMPYFIGELTLSTAFRTAAMSLLAARYLARKNSKTMAIIGNGCQSEFQALAFYYEFGLEKLHLFDIDRVASEKLKANLAHTGMQIEIFDSVAAAVKGVDIITTITAEYSRAHILTADMIEPGMYINAVGGDSPGKTELDPEILHRCDGVFVEFEEQTRIEGELQNVEPDFPVQHLYHVFAGEQVGRTSDEQVIVFDSVGFALEDYSALKFMRDAAQELGLLRNIRLVPDLADPKNLFGYMNVKAGARESIPA